MWIPGGVIGVFLATTCSCSSSAPDAGADVLPDSAVGLRQSFWTGKAYHGGDQVSSTPVRVVCDADCHPRAGLCALKQRDRRGPSTMKSC